jgi:hypothetical protein
MQIQTGASVLYSPDRMDVLSKDDGWHYPHLSDNVIIRVDLLSPLVLILVVCSLSHASSMAVFERHLFLQ